MALYHLQPDSVKVFGAGAWGSVLAGLIKEVHPSVSIWNRTPKPGSSTCLTQCLTPDAHIIIAISVQHVSHLFDRMRSKNISPRVLWVASKGLDGSCGKLLWEIAQERFPDAIIGVFSGPNIAREIASGLPCGITIACRDPDTLLQGKALFPPRLIVETTTDVIGVSWWGALKNVMAIGYGLLQQRNVGYNMSATFLVQCAKEISAIVQEKGGCFETMLSFAGMGDLVLTSHCPQGRNRFYGEHFPEHPTHLVEGLDTLRALTQHTLAEKGWNIPTPIIQSISDIIYSGMDINHLSSLV
jgi:glycerol-3-phosphate dehydrogenase (NAD(P)+)